MRDRANAKRLLEAKMNVCERASRARISTSGAILRIHPLKAAFDKGFALCALVLFSPLMALIMLGIKLDGWLYREDRGSIFYREAQVSQGRVFILCKLWVVKTAAMEVARRKKGYDHAC